jgi:hypothetical protein
VNCALVIDPCSFGISGKGLTVFLPAILDEIWRDLAKFGPSWVRQAAVLLSVVPNANVVRVLRRTAGGGFSGLLLALLTIASKSALMASAG